MPICYAGFNKKNEFERLFSKNILLLKYSKFKTSNIKNIILKVLQITLFFINVPVCLYKQNV